MDDRLRASSNRIEPPWDEVRHQRNWKDISSRIRRVEEQPRRRGDSRRTVLVAAATAALVAAGAAGLVWLGVYRSSGGVLRSGSTTSPPGRETSLTLIDGSTAMLSRHARVDVIAQTGDRIRLRQASGSVRYTVRQGASRSFVVSAPGVEIRVVGTVFTVAVYKAKAVTISVERGKVEVISPGGNRLLSAGESLRTRGARTSERWPDMDTSASHPPDLSPPLVAPEKSTPGQRTKPDGPRPGGTPARTSSALTRAEVGELLGRVDRARRAGRFSEAARLLHRIISRASRDPRMTAVLFTLGRVEAARGRHASAAKAFRRCRLLAPSGSLAEDALAAEARAWAAASRLTAARAAARAYLRAFPAGTHAKRMKAITQ